MHSPDRHSSFLVDRSQVMTCRKVLKERSAVHVVSDKVNDMMMSLRIDGEQICARQNISNA